MSRLFTSSPATYLTVDSGLSVSTGDITIGVWYWLDTSHTYVTALCVGGDDGSRLMLVIGGTYFEGFVSGSTSANFVSTVVPTTVGWRCVALRVSSGTCRVVHHGVENATGGTVTGRTAPSQQSSVGGRRNIADTSGSQYWDGYLGHFAMWERAVPNAELLDMASNLKSPLWYPTSLTHYYRIAGTASPEPDTQSATSLTVVGAVSATGPTLSDPPPPAAPVALSAVRPRIYINSLDKSTSVRA